MNARRTHSLERLHYAARLASERGLSVQTDPAARFLSLHHENSTVVLQFDPDSISLIVIEVDDDRRGQGIGSRLLNDVAWIADQTEMPVRLFAMSMIYHEEPGLKQGALCAWYRRYGYEGDSVFLNRPPTAKCLAA
jgi:GNAT superfamily N-acetyltransferase